MTMTVTLKAACLVALTVALTHAPAATKKEIDQALSEGGLQKLKVKDIELAYARPGASLAAYKRVKLDPVEVEFRKSKDPARTGSAVKLSDEEREKIRSNVARAVQEEFAKELQKSSTYQVASGQVLARVADRRDASKEGRMYLVNGTVNEQEARKIAAGWARTLRKALDKAHGIGS